MYYKDIRFMEDATNENGPKYIFAGINPGDYTYFGAWKFTVTQEALDCDCGKGMFCPLVKQERR